MANQCTGLLSSPKATGSTSQGASLVQCIPGFGFGKDSAQSWPFVSIAWLILVESQEKPKQIPPKSYQLRSYQSREGNLC
jgi:hypothetical protein